MNKLELATIRADEARRILESDLFKAAFEDTRQAYMNMWADLDRVSDKYAEQAADMHRMVKLLDKVRRCLEVHIETGKLATREIEGRTRWFGLRRA